MKASGPPGLPGELVGGEEAGVDGEVFVVVGPLVVGGIEDVVVTTVEDVDVVVSGTVVVVGHSSWHPSGCVVVVGAKVVEVVDSGTVVVVGGSVVELVLVEVVGSTVVVVTSVEVVVGIVVVDVGTSVVVVVSSSQPLASEMTTVECSPVYQLTETVSGIEKVGVSYSMFLTLPNVPPLPELSE